AVPDPRLLLVVPPLGADPLPRQVDDGPDPLESLGVDDPPVGIPADRLSPTFGPHHGNHPVPGALQRTPESPPDQPGRSRDDDVHKRPPGTARPAAAANPCSPPTLAHSRPDGHTG